MARLGAQNIDPITTGNTDYGSLDISSTIEPTLDLAVTLCQQFTFDLYANLPMNHDLTLQGYDVGSTKAFMPTATFLYHPLTDSEWDPYVGVGATYTTFSNSSTSVSYPIPVTLALKDTLSPTFQFGLDYHVTKHWILSSGIRYSPLSPQATINGTEYDSIDIKLLTYGLTLGFQI